MQFFTAWCKLLPGNKPIEMHGSCKPQHLLTEKLKIAKDPDCGSFYYN
jgi:hypothetical protein